MQRLRTAALLGRRAGLLLLRDGLLTDPRLQLVCVAAHSRLPRSEDPSRGPRPEFSELRAVCEGAGVPLIAADSREAAADLGFLEPHLPIDLLCAVGWRFVVSARGLSIPRLGSINLHRGRLPDYAGAAPVLRMIQDGLQEVEISAHLMTEQVDGGPVLATVRLPIERRPGIAPAAVAEEVKERLLPLYAPLARLAVTALLARSQAATVVTP